MALRTNPLAGFCCCILLAVQMIALMCQQCELLQALVCQHLLTPLPFLRLHLCLLLRGNAALAGVDLFRLHVCVQAGLHHFGQQGGICGRGNGEFAHIVEVAE